MKKFKRISKICVILFLVVTAVVVGFAMTTQEQEIVLPSIIGIAWVITGIAAVVCIGIAMVFDAIEGWKKDKVSYLLGYLVSIGVLWLIVVALDYFIMKNDIQLLYTLAESAIIVCGGKAGSYIFAK